MASQEVVNKLSDRDRRPDMRLCFVAADVEIVESIVKNAVRLALDGQLRKRAGRARELLFDLLHVVGEQMTIAASPDEVADLESGLLRDHMREQGVGSD